MTRILTALLIALLVIPLVGISDSTAAEGKRFKPRGRCVTVSNGRHRVRINCGRPKTNIEFGRFDFGVSIAEGVESATSRSRPRTTSTSDSSPRTAARDEQERAPASEGCHPAYTPCMPADRDVSCEEALGIANGEVIRLR